MERPALNELGALLDSLEIRWVLIGALAANRYRSSPRLTQDVDLLLSDFGPGLETLEQALLDASWQVERAGSEADLLRLRHPQFGIADLLIAGTDYQQEAIRRAREEVIDPATRVRVLTAEDVIVHKLIAGRAQDLADIEAVLASHVELDRAYIEQWVEFWGVQETWAALRRGD